MNDETILGCIFIFWFTQLLYSCIMWYHLAHDIKKLDDYIKGE